MLVAQAVMLDCGWFGNPSHAQEKKILRFCAVSGIGAKRNKVMKSVWRARRRGSSGREIYVSNCSLLFFFFFPFFLNLSVRAVCGWRGAGWISRKGGWDARRLRARKGRYKENTVSYCRGRSCQTVKGGSWDWIGGRAVAPPANVSW